MNYRIILIALVALIGSLFSTQAQYLEMRHYTEEKGFPGVFVYHNFQDSRGYLWTCTGLGASRFDGFEFRNFSVEDTLQPVYATTGIEDDQGVIYFGTNTGLILSVTYGRIDTVVKGSMERGKIIALKKGPDGEIYGLAQSGGLFRVMEDTIESYPVSELEMHFPSSFEMIDSSFLIGSNMGLLMVDFSPKHKAVRGVRSFNEIEYRQVTCISKRKKLKGAWIGVEDGGLWDFQLGPNNYTLIPAFRSKRIENVAVSTVIEDHKGQLWIGTRFDGIYRVKLDSDGYLNEDGLWLQIDHDNILPDNEISSLFEDNEGTVWVGLFGHGLVQLIEKKSDFLSLKKQGVLEVYDILRHSSGKLILATDKGLYLGAYLNGSDSLSFQAMFEQLPIEITALCEAADSSVLVGTGMQGVALLSKDLQDLRSIEYSTVPYPNRINNIRYVADRKEYFIAETGAGAHVLDSNLSYSFTISIEGGFISNEISDVLEGENGALWVGSHGTGLSRWNADGSWTHLTQEGVFPATEINCLMKDHEDKLWVGTEDQGLYKIEGDKITLLTTDSGLISNVVVGLTEDEANNLWIAHRSGVNMIENTTKEISTYSQKEGYPMFQTTLNSTTKDQWGNILIGSDEGITRINSPVENFMLSPNPLLVVGVREFHKEVPTYHYTDNTSSARLQAKTIFYTHERNHLTFDFISISLKDPAGVTYRHYLGGFDKEWSPIETKHSASYTNLEPGEYDFHVEVFYKGMKRKTEIVKQSAYIQKPFWNRWWFYLTEIIVFASLVYLTYHNSKKGNPRATKFLLYISLFILFDYVRHLVFPLFDNYINGVPVLNLIAHLLMGLLLIPVEGWVRKLILHKQHLEAAK